MDEKLRTAAQPTSMHDEPPPAAMDDAALVERLQGWATQPNAVSQDLRRDLAQAADRIAALTADLRAEERGQDNLRRCLAAANGRAEGMRVALDAHKRAYAYLQDRLRSLGYEGWARDYDGEIAALAATGAPDD